MDQVDAAESKPAASAGVSIQTVLKAFQHRKTSSKESLGQTGEDSGGVGDRPTASLLGTPKKKLSERWEQVSPSVKSTLERYSPRRLKSWFSDSPADVSGTEENGSESMEPSYNLTPSQMVAERKSRYARIAEFCLGDSSPAVPTPSPPPAEVPCPTDTVDGDADAPGYSSTVFISYETYKKIPVESNKLHRTLKESPTSKSSPSLQKAQSFQNVSEPVSLTEKIFKNTWVASQEIIIEENAPRDLKVKDFKTRANSISHINLEKDVKPLHVANDSAPAKADSVFVPLKPTIESSKGSEATTTTIPTSSDILETAFPAIHVNFHSPLERLACEKPLETEFPISETLCEQPDSLAENSERNRTEDSISSQERNKSVGEPYQREKITTSEREIETSENFGKESERFGGVKTIGKEEESIPSEPIQKEESAEEDSGQHQNPGGAVVEKLPVKSSKPQKMPVGPPHITLSEGAERPLTLFPPPANPDQLQRKSPVTVQEWVDHLPHKPNPPPPEMRPEDPPIVIESAALLRCQATSRLSREPSVQSSSSLDSLLDSRKPDPVEVLLNLGFGGVPGIDLDNCRIPKRFLVPSKCKGGDWDEFLRRELLQVQNFECTSLGFRGLSGPSHQRPSAIVANIMEKLREQTAPRPPPRIANRFTSVAKRVLSETSVLSRLTNHSASTSVLNPDNRKFLESQGKISPEVPRRRIIFGEKSFAINKDGELVDDEPSPTKSTTAAPSAGSWSVGSGVSGDGDADSEENRSEADVAVTAADLLRMRRTSLQRQRRVEANDEDEDGPAEPHRFDVVDEDSEDLRDAIAAEIETLSRRIQSAPAEELVAILRPIKELKGKLTEL